MLSTDVLLMGKNDTTCLDVSYLSYHRPTYSAPNYTLLKTGSVTNNRVSSA